MQNSLICAQKHEFHRKHS